MAIHSVCTECALECMLVFVYLMQTFGDNKYLEKAKQCGEVIWERGLLLKGFGICHGVSGNAYAFLKLYQLTKHPAYLYRACKVCPARECNACVCVCVYCIYSVQQVCMHMCCYIFSDLLV